MTDRDPATVGLDLYLVGGAVRDRLLGRPVKERDWVVVGATPEEMEQRGFRPVGKDFPVFLHPDSHEEYALARTERKTAPGYRGFTVHATPDVTLEQDLERRDLTVNAMAETPEGTLVDPFNGRADLDARRLRHVSDAFREDPVRILRLARFSARYHPMGFRPASDTMELAREMVAAGEVDALVPERVWQEWRRALTEAAPAVFIEVLRECGALQRLLPEIDALFGVPQPPRHHPEVDTGVHTLMVLEQAARLSDDPVVRFAALLHDLGKGTTPRHAWPRHIAHEQRGIPLVNRICDRFKVPNDYRDLALIVCRHHLLCHQAADLRPETILSLLEKCDAFRRPERFRQYLIACEADARGRTGLEERDYPQRALLTACLDAAGSVSGADFAAQGLKGEEVGAAVRKARLTAIRATRATAG